MSEYFEGVEGNWVQENFSSPNWKKGHWRHIERTVTQYRNGQFYDLDDKREHSYQSLGAANRSTYWERFVPVVKVPTEPGVYRDKDGDLWTLNGYDGWYLFTEDGLWEESDPVQFKECLPFEFVTFIKKEEK